MKKILLILFSFLFAFGSTNLVSAVEKPTEVTFIYINGSNNLAYKNRLNFKVTFVEDLQKMHPEIKKNEADALVHQNDLQKRL